MEKPMSDMWSSAGLQCPDSKALMELILIRSRMWRPRIVAPAVQRLALLHPQQTFESSIDLLLRTAIADYR